MFNCDVDFHVFHIADRLNDTDLLSFGSCNKELRGNVMQRETWATRPPSVMIANPTALLTSKAPPVRLELSPYWNREEVWPLLRQMPHLEKVYCHYGYTVLGARILDETKQHLLPYYQIRVSTAWTCGEARLLVQLGFANLVRSCSTNYYHTKIFGAAELDETFLLEELPQADCPLRKLIYNGLMTETFLHRFSRAFSGLVKLSMTRLRVGDEAAVCAFPNLRYLRAPGLLDCQVQHILRHSSITALDTSANHSKVLLALNTPNRLTTLSLTLERLVDRTYSDITVDVSKLQRLIVVQTGPGDHLPLQQIKFKGAATVVHICCHGLHGTAQFPDCKKYEKGVY